jgi:tRNA (adenine22-N1)-methyltransferase
MERLNEIFSQIKRAGVIADIGCDHGYISKMVANANIADKIVMTDISEKCLNKARALLKDEIASAKAVSFVTSGLTGIDFKVDEAVIAGMGGEEIIHILEECLSRTGITTLVLQPMKNPDKLRRFLVDNGFFIERDYTFKDGGKFYDLIVAVLNGKKDFYTDDDYEFGKENLIKKGDDFKEKYLKEINSIKTWLQSPDIKQESVNAFNDKIKKYQKVIFQYED